MTFSDKRSPTTVAGSEDGEIVAMRRRIAELTAAVEARDTFIAVAGHELRNPMTPLMGQIDLLLAALRTGRCPADQVEHRMTRIQRTMSQYIKRADILLEVSRINSGRLRLELEPCDIAILLHDMADQFAADALREGVPVVVTAPTSLSGTWDRLALEQIIDNLISNALKHGAGTPVEVSAELCGEQVCLRVCDHGNGIPVEARERVFGRFERAIARGEHRSGFGIGLWVVHQLTQAMGGTVVLGDTEGGGAAFAVNLPRYVEATRS